MFFGENSQTVFNDIESSIRMEVISFLSDPCTDDLKILKKYPHIRKVFIKYNSILPSSAPIERVFSYASKYHVISGKSATSEYELVLFSDSFIYCLVVAYKFHKSCISFFFSNLEMILRPHRQKLDDELFEKLLILKTTNIL